MGGNYLSCTLAIVGHQLLHYFYQGLIVKQMLLDEWRPLSVHRPSSYCAGFFHIFVVGCPESYARAVFPLVFLYLLLKKVFLRFQDSLFSL